MNRRIAAVGAFVAAGAVLAGCSSSTTLPGAGSDGPPAVGSDWAEIEELAAEEGTLALGVMSIPGFQEWAEYADEQLETIDIEITATPFDSFIPRVVTEQDNGAYLWDVMVGPLTNIYAGLHPDHLQDISVMLDRLPAELTADAAWGGGFEQYADPADPRSFINEYLLGTAITVNRKEITAAELDEPRDLLDPRWRGEICINDPRLVNQASMGLSWFLESPEYGEEFVTTLLRDQDVVLMDTITATSEAFAKGNCAIAIGADARTINEMRDAGIDIEYEVLDGYGNFLLAWGVSVLEGAPHPNAAHVFLAWFLSEDGQKSYVDMVRADATTRQLDVAPGPYGPSKVDFEDIDGYPVRPGTSAGSEAIKRMTALAEQLLSN